METKKMKEIITSRWGTVDNFIKETECSIGREHLYRIIHHQSRNPTALKIQELSRCLGISSDDILKEMLEDAGT